MMKLSYVVLRVVVTSVAGAASALSLSAQAPARADTLRLDVLQQAAESSDRRAPQARLLAQQSALRLQTIDADKRPAIAATAQAQYLSEVTSVGAALPAGLKIPNPYQDQYDGYLNVRQRIYDPSLSRRLAVEQAQLTESEAALHSTIWSARLQVNDAFFTVLRLDAQRASLDAAIADLEAQRTGASDRVQNGTALQSEVLLLDAEIARRRKSRDETVADRAASADVLSSLTGRQISVASVLSVPDLASTVAAVRAGLSGDRSRPEYAQFAASTAAIAARKSAAAAQDLPRVSAFGRAGYGRPGLNQLSREFGTYWLAGVQVEWTPWNWHTTTRDEEIQDLQAKIVASNEAAFTENVRRSVTRDLATIDELQASLAADDSIVALREQILTETRYRLGEGVVTSASFVDRETDLLTARLERDSDRLRLAEARAHFLTTVGHEVR